MENFDTGKTISVFSLELSLANPIPLGRKADQQVPVKSCLGGCGEDVESGDCGRVGENQSRSFVSTPIRCRH